MMSVHRNRMKPRQRPVLGEYVLRLYTSGSTARSARAVRNLKRIFEARLLGRYRLDIIDIYQQPTWARRDSVIAVPALIKEFPLPRRMLVGDFSDEKKVVSGLSITDSFSGP
jgi:circadian clock protein KaiB